jgi:hypothetical protein
LRRRSRIWVVFVEENRREKVVVRSMEYGVWVGYSGLDVLKDGSGWRLDWR